MDTKVNSRSRLLKKRKNNGRSELDIVVRSGDEGEIGILEHVLSLKSNGALLALASQAEVHRLAAGVLLSLTSDLGTKETVSGLDCVISNGKGNTEQTAAAL